VVLQVVTPEEFVPTSSVGVGEAPELLSENCPAAVEVPYGTSDHSIPDVPTNG
jgi:hypothetical protein